jgi:4-hydroxy-tetrahydrodipicolinate reductase
VIRVGVLGAAGKMGRAVCEAVRADADLELVARIDPAGGEGYAAGPEALVEAGAEVAVDFTRPDTVADNVRFCVEHGVHCVVGTTGVDHEVLRDIAQGGRANVFVAPNFSIGAVLAMRFSAEAARYLGSAEVVELHHNQKLDAPSGTAWETARRIARSWAEHGRAPGGEPAAGEQEKVAGARGADVDGVRVHSVRMAGLVAHQEVVLGGEGEILTIRHDSIDRTSFMAGVVLAVRKVAALPGLTVGLEHLLDR